MQHTTYLELEQEISKFSCAIAARDGRIANDLLAHLRSRFSLEEIAGVVLVSLEQMIWLDAEAFVWAVDNLVPLDVRQEIRRIMALAVSKRLIGKGFQPGKDFSVDGAGKLLLSARAQVAVLG